MGGEFSGVNLYISENFSEDVLGSNTGLLISAGVFGAVIATGFGAIVTSDYAPDWAWRIPFIIGGICSLSVFKARRQMKETEDFEKTQNKGDILVYVWKELLKNHKASLLIGLLISGLTIIPLYSATILGNTLFKELGYSTSESMLLNLAAMIVDGLCIAFFGKMADKIGFQNQMLLGTVSTTLLAIPAFWFISGTHTSTLDVLLFINLLIISGCIINGCAMPYIAKLFPTNCRYSGLAASVTFGHALLGGTTPIIGAYFSKMLDSRLAPAGWVFAISFLSFLGVLFLGKSRKTSASRPIIAQANISA